jgi:hypothetical protein
MDTSEVDYVNNTLVSYMYTAAKLRTKTSESPKEYQIPIHTVFNLLKRFLEKGSRFAMNHLQLIEDMCTLFKLAEVSKNEAMKLLYLSLDNEA